MRALIIAAGLGTRLRSVTGGSKCLCFVRGKPILSHSLEAFQSAGISEVVVIIGYDKDNVERVVGGRGKCVFNPTFASAGVLRTVWCAREHLRGKSFVFTPGDHYFHPKLLNGMIDFKGDIGVLVERKVCDEEDVKVIVTEDKLFFGKDLSSSDAVGELTGLMVFSERSSKILFDLLDGRIDDVEQQYLFQFLMVLQERGVHISPIYCDSGLRIEIDFPTH